MGTEFIDELPEAQLSSWERSRQLAEFVTDLRANLGRWAEYPVPIAAASKPTRASEIRRGEARAFREGTFEASVRDGVLYVRAVAA